MAETNTANNTTTEQRSKKSTIGTAGIELTKQLVQILKPYELSPERKLDTFRMMMLDDAVFSAFDANAVFIEKSFANYHIECNLNSKQSKLAKAFLEWNLNRLDGQTVRSIARSAAEFKRDGLAPFEKVFERGYGDWETTPEGNKAWKIKSLNYLSPLTLYRSEPFKIEDGGRKVTEMRQSLNALQNSSSTNLYKNKTTKGYIRIPMSKVILMTYSATDSQPFGTSPFEACYTAWREKVLLQDLTSVGVSKDLAGTPVLRLPAQILDDASNNPSGAAGQMVSNLREAIANLHAGDQASMILPSDTYAENGSGQMEYDITFLGVQGSGKTFDLEALVEQRRKFIFSVFGAANLLSNDSSGGYNQLEGQTNLHYNFIERDISVIEEAWNTNLIPQLFRLNEWDLPEEDLPKLRAGELSPASMDEVSKAVQRVGAVGYLPKTKEVVNEILKKLGFEYQVPENISQEELQKLLGEMTTRSGDGMADGMNDGVGSSTGSSGNSSDTNSENTA